MAEERNKPVIEAAPDITRVGEGYVPTYILGLMAVGIAGTAIAGGDFVVHRLPEAAFALKNQAEFVKLTELLSCLIRNHAVMAEMSAGGFAAGMAITMGIAAAEFHKFSKEVVSRGRQAIGEVQKAAEDIKSEVGFDNKGPLASMLSTQKLWKFEHQVLKREAIRQAN